MKRLTFSAVLLISLLFGTGCKSILAPLPENSDPKTLPQYWLTTSLYVGPFFDEERLKLVDCRPFFAIGDAENLDGQAVLPKEAQGVIPAGTLVTILQISYPDDQLGIKRPLFTPRNNIWVYLRIGRERGRVTVFYDQPHILILPRNITTETQAQGYLKRFLSTKDPNHWLLMQESHFQSGIFHKKPVLGMKRQHLISALGPAIKKQYQKPRDFDKAQEIWHYYDYLITIEDEIVNKITPLKNLAAKDL